MAEDQNGRNISVSVPMGIIGAALALGVAAAAYALVGRDDEEGASTSSAPRGRGMRRKLGLMTLVTLIENDASRKVLVALLRAMARRS
ncbi:MAG TPA: hypothetical protein VKX16_01010 [Chloroflexota bacterium]|nr:hypothetical protein [Chloroflexota bacterium]